MERPEVPTGEEAPEHLQIPVGRLRAVREGESPGVKIGR